MDQKLNITLIVAVAMASKVDPKDLAAIMVDERGRLEFLKEFTADYAERVLKNLSEKPVPSPFK